MDNFKRYVHKPTVVMAIQITKSNRNVWDKWALEMSDNERPLPTAALAWFNNYGFIESGYSGDWLVVDRDEYGDEFSTLLNEYEFDHRYSQFPHRIYPNSNLQEGEPQRIYDAVARGESMKSVADRHGVTYHTVNNLWLGKTWAEKVIRWFHEGKEKWSVGERRRGVRDEQIRDEYRTGKWTQATLAEKYQTSRKTIYVIVKGIAEEKGWKRGVPVHKRS